MKKTLIILTVCSKQSTGDWTNNDESKTNHVPEDHKLPVEKPTMKGSSKPKEKEEVVDHGHGPYSKKENPNLGNPPAKPSTKDIPRDGKL